MVHEIELLVGEIRIKGAERRTKKECEHNKDVISDKVSIINLQSQASKKRSRRKIQFISSSEAVIESQPSRTDLQDYQPQLPAIFEAGASGPASSDQVRWVSNREWLAYWTVATGVRGSRLLAFVLACRSTHVFDRYGDAGGGTSARCMILVRMCFLLIVAIITSYWWSLDTSLSGSLISQSRRFLSRQVKPSSCQDLALCDHNTTTKTLRVGSRVREADP